MAGSHPRGGCPRYLSLGGGVTDFIENTKRRGLVSRRLVFEEWYNPSMPQWFKRLLIPSPDNDFKPNALQRSALVGMTALVMISFSFANVHSLLWVASDWLVSTILPAVVTDATNAARTEEGRAPLTRNSALDEAARLKAEDMAANGYFAHWSPDGVSPWHWFKEAGYSYKHAGENLAVHFTDSDDVVDAWLDSPTHRENIMDERFTEIGIGTAKGSYQGYDTVFVVQMFGTPALPVKEIETDVVPEADEVAEAEPEVDTAPEVAGVSESEDVIGVTEAGTVVYESFAATTNDDAALRAASAPEPPSSFWGRLATSPRLVLQIFYSVIALFVIMVLLLSIIVEWRRQHPVQIAYGVAMLAFMAVMFSVHVFVSSGVVIA